MDDPATATLIATDATIRRSLGAWSAVFADGRAFTGAGTAVDINDAETRGALLGVEAARAAAGIVLITDSQALLDAYRAGIGALAGLPVWGGFMAAVRARGRAWPVVRRAASPCERRLHRAAHNLADAAWHAAAEGSDPAPIAELARRADVVFTSAEEAAAVFGTSEPARLASLLPDVAELVVTRGGEGSVLVAEGRQAVVLAWFAKAFTGP